VERATRIAMHIPVVKLKGYLSSMPRLMAEAMLNEASLTLY